MVIARSKLGLITLIALLALAIGACSGTLPAELPAEAEVEVENGSLEELEFSGPIEQMGAENWTVSGVTFAVNSNTEIQPGLEIGDDVKVHAQLDAADQLTAREIQAINEKDDEAVTDHDESDEDEFTGTVDSIGAESWVIGGTTVAITNSTEIKGDLQVGDMAKVHASMVDGVLTAREIEPVDHDDLNDDDDGDDEDEFYGVVESISPGSWVIDGTTVAITSSTEIKGNLQVGDMVKVHASMVDGVLTAREIEPANGEDRDDDDDESEDDDYYGIVEAIADDTWTIGGRVFTVSSETDIDDDIQLGDMVKVELETDSSGTVFVEEIELADDDLDGDSDDDFDDDHDEDDDDEHDDEDEEDDDEADDHDDDHDDDDDDEYGDDD